jgi:hypothetical protein
MTLTILKSLTYKSEVKLTPGTTFLLSYLRQHVYVSHLAVDIHCIDYAVNVECQDEYYTAKP